MKAVVAAFNQEKALVGAFSVLTNLRMELFQAQVTTHVPLSDQTQTLLLCCIQECLSRENDGLSTYFVFDMELCVDIKGSELMHQVH